MKILAKYNFIYKNDSKMKPTKQMQSIQTRNSGNNAH
jgi:hypothetical protein